MQETARSDIVMLECLKADIGGNGEPSVLDSNLTIQLSQPEKSDHCHTELRADHSGDHGKLTSKSFASIESAGSEQALPGGEQEHGLCDDKSVTEDDRPVVEDVTLPATLQQDDPDERLCDYSDTTTVIDYVSTFQATLQQDQLDEPWCGDSRVREGRHHAAIDDVSLTRLATFEQDRRHDDLQGDKKTEDKAMVGDVSTVPAAPQGTQPDDGPPLCNRVMAEDDHQEVVEDGGSTVCADISSGVSLMDIDVNEGTIDSTISTGSAVSHLVSIRVFYYTVVSPPRSDSF